MNLLLPGPTEIWKDIPGYEGLYQVSNLGRVKSAERKVGWEFYNKPCARKHKERIIVAEVAKNGYKRVGLSKDGKRTRYHLHRIIAKAFIPNPNNYPVINHKNGIKTDNRLENLEWTTYSENNYHAWRVLNKKAKNARAVRCKETGEVFETLAKASIKYGKNRCSLSAALRKGKDYYRKLHWEFV